MLSSTINLPSNIGLPLVCAILSRVSRAASLFPEAALYLADSGNHEVAAITKTRLGRLLRARSHLQPPDVMISAANRTSRQAPKAQKQSMRTTHLALCLMGRNSAKRVTD